MRPDGRTLRFPPLSTDETGVRTAALIEDVVRDTTQQGGTTKSLTGEPNPITGYAVAVAGFERRVPLKGWGFELHRWLEEVQDNLRSPGRYVGTWIHDGHVVFDVVRVFPDNFLGFDTAMRLARLQGEQAIYSLHDGVEIPA